MKEQIPVEKRRAAGALRKQTAAARSSGGRAVDPAMAAAGELGNAVFQRRIRSQSPGGTVLPDETAQRIEQARSGGRALDSAVQYKMGEALGADFGGVRVHTGQESHVLNEELNALAFTTGQDIFFRENQYNPNSSGGQELLAHELTHVVQQSSGAVKGGAKMTVNDPHDRFEQEADAAARMIAAGGAAPQVLRQEFDEEELQAKAVQRQEFDDEELQAKSVQRQELSEDELAAP